MPHRKHHDFRGYYARQAKAIYRLQMREAIMRWTVEGVSDTEIAARLGQSIPTIRRYREESRLQARMVALDPESAYDRRADLPADPARTLKRGPGPGPHVAGSWKNPLSRAKPPQLPSPPPRRRIRDVNDGHVELHRPIRLPSELDPPESTSIEVLTGTIVLDPDEILDDPEIEDLRNRCLDLRKAMYTFREMGQELGISEQDARAHTAYALRSLQDSDTTHADLERRLMVEQIDDMIRAIRPQTVSTKGKEPVLEAIDRMLKLMDRKAKLLGLDQAESVDIMIRLQRLADEGNYDMVELMDLAKDTLAHHRIKMPLHLVSGEQDTDDAPAETG